MDAQIKRFDWIDAAKGLLIICIVFGHVSGEHYYDHFIFSFHVPAFFVLTGILLYEKGSCSFAKKRVWKCVVQYICFNILAIGMRFLFLLVLDGSNLLHDMKIAILKFLSGYGMLALWYIYSYVIARLLFSFIEKRLCPTMRYITYASSLALSLVCKIVVRDNIFSFHIFAQESFLGYFLIGLCRSFACAFYIFVGYKGQTIWYLIPKTLREKKNILLVSFVLLLIDGVLVSINGFTNFAVLNMGRYPILVYICGVTGSWGVLLLCRLMFERKSPKILKYYGQNSLIVMATHMSLLLVEVSLWITSRIIRISSGFFFSDLFCSLVRMVIIMLIEIGIIEGMKRFCPFLVK